MIAPDQQFVDDYAYLIRSIDDGDTGVANEASSLLCGEKFSPFDGKKA